MRYGSLKKKTEFVIGYHADIKDLNQRIEALRATEDEVGLDSLQALSHQWRKAEKATQKENDEIGLSVE